MNAARCRLAVGAPNCRQEAGGPNCPLPAGGPHNTTSDAEMQEFKNSTSAQH
jgi:hypothetical protein